jgi:hypothetical protein
MRRHTGYSSPSWLAVLRFTSVDEHPVHRRLPGIDLPSAYSLSKWLATLRFISD